MNGNDRGQMSGGVPVLMFGAVAITVVSIVILVGMDVANEFAEGVNESAFEQAAENTTTACSGTTVGCGGTIDLIPMIAFVMVAVVIVGLLRFATGTGSRSTDRNPTDGKSEVEILKDAYVDGDIQTTVKLENDLDELLDADIDDRDVQELDDLLDDSNDNGDENDESD